MKKVKKANVEVIIESHRNYKVNCPHCHTGLQGNIIGTHIKVLYCFYCKNPIELIFEELI